MSFLKFKTIETEPTAAESMTPAASPAQAEVFTVPAECWKCHRDYNCHVCPHGLKTPIPYTPGTDLQKKMLRLIKRKLQQMYQQEVAGNEIDVGLLERLLNEGQRLKDEIAEGNQNANQMLV